MSYLKMAEPELLGQGQHGMATDETVNTSPSPPNNGKPSDHAEEPPKKRRRTAKPNADKKFECKHEGCGKSYSRAEHLYRHQLNHTPKNIYHCDFPDCNRYFVRQDLCVRHRERHTTAGSQLHKRDSFAQASQTVGPSKQANGTGDDPYDGSEDGTGRQDLLSPELMDVEEQSRPQKKPTNTSPSQNVIDPRFIPPTPATSKNRSSYINGRSQSFGESTDRHQGWNQRRDSTSYSSIRPNSVQAHAQSVPHSPSILPNGMADESMAFGSAIAHVSAYDLAQQRYGGYSTDTSNNYGMNMHQPVMRPVQNSYNMAMQQGLSSHADTYLYSHVNNMHPSMDMNAAYGFPIFGAEEPFAMNDEFTAWLFNPQAVDHTTHVSPDMMNGTYSDHSIIQGQDSVPSQSPNNSLPTPGQASMAVSSVLETASLASYIMSESKRQELLDIMRVQFIERPHDAVNKRKEMVFEGDVNADDHILSLRMMHTYIGSYWYHQHAQLPILHKPTFSADKTPTLLLLAVIAIGSATLDKAYGTSLTDSAAELANFIVWHLRWEIMRDLDFRPPAKLWVFQTMLLIEVYEKMYSTRTLHERAHIHHDSTLTLMRRGSSFVGRAASDSNTSGSDDQPSKSQNGGQKKSDETWHRWINTEATRRAAFGAFVLDSIHCTMFGHSAKMVAHEMRLPLPCDEALWSATSPAEVSRVQASLQINGVKPIYFLDGLKRTLNCQTVRTNSFGRTIIMAGLLSVSWHMNQRDLQIASIGPRAANSIGGPDKWKGTLLRAFDNWKRDFDEALAESAASGSLSTNQLNAATQSAGMILRPVDDENIFESRTVLHHLAHIAAHVDIIDCQVYAGASRLLSRNVTPHDYGLVKEKMEKWALRATARDSAFYALKFITTVLVPPGKSGNPDGIDSRLYGHASPILPQAYDSDRYIARDDFLLNRPWVLYVSALVVWCYGFALEGPIIPAPRDEDFATYEQKESDMRDFLDSVAGVRAPDDLEHVAGKNRCLGLLLLLKDSFHSTRWELTHEAAGLLGNAALKLKGVDDNEEQSTVPASLNSKGTTRKTNGTAFDIANVEFGSTVSAFNIARP